MANGPEPPIHLPLRRVPVELCSHFFIHYCSACGVTGYEVMQEFSSCKVLTEELWKKGSHRWTIHNRGTIVCVYCLHRKPIESSKEAREANHNDVCVLPVP